MWLLALEALVALAMLILIVWLTMGARRKDADQSRDSPDDPDRGAS